MVGGNNIDAFKRVGGPGASRKGKGKGSGKRATPGKSRRPQQGEGQKDRAPRDRAAKEKPADSRARSKEGKSGAKRRTVGGGASTGAGPRQEPAAWRKQASGAGLERPAPDRRRGGGQTGGLRHAKLFGQYSAATLWGSVGFGFFCGFATLFGGYSPFGILAVTAALFGWDIAYAMPVIAGALVGTALGAGASAAVGLAISAALLEVIRKPLWPYIAKGSDRQAGSWATGACVLLCTFIGSALAHEISGSGVHVLVVSFVEASLAGASAAVVVPTVTTWAQSGRMKAPGRVESAALLVIMAAICAGLDWISLAGISPGAAVGLYASAIAGVLAGPGAGAIVGASLGIGLSIARSGHGILIGVLTLAGAASGIVSKQGRAITAFSMLLAAMLSGYQLRTIPEFTARMIEASLAAIGFLLTPQSLFSELSWRLPERAGGSDRDRMRMDGVHHLVMGRLSVLGQTFGELAAIYQGGPIGDLEDMADGDDGEKDGDGGRGIASGSKAGPEPRGGLLPGQAWRSDIQEIDDPFEAASYDSPYMRAARAAASIRSQACNGCPKHDVCWRDMVFRTYRDLVDLLASIELFGEDGIESLADGFKNRCIRTERVIAASLSATGRRRAGAALGGRLGREGHQGTEAILDKSSAVNILALQMAGVADAISRVSSQAQGMARFDEEAEALIRRQLSAEGIGIKSVRVSWTGHGGLEVDIVKSPCRQDGECVRTIAPLVGDVIGRPVSVWQADCFYARAEGTETGVPDTDEDDTYHSATAAGIGIERLWKLKSGRDRPGKCDECSIRLLPARKYNLESEAVTLPRTPGETSGDSHALVNLGDGRMAVIIADGMGVGEAASEESGAAVAMLVRLLEAGLDLDFAVQSVNAVMLLRSDDDRFTTVDLAVVNLYTGQAEMVKAGAPPSFIKRGHDVIAIGDPSVPAGVQAPTRVMRYRMNLEEGDILIMVSDGVTEAVGDGPESGMELVRVMERADSDLPRKVAEDVVEWARGTSLGLHDARGGGGARTGSASTRQAAYGKGRQGTRMDGWDGRGGRGGRGGRDERGGSIESIDDITVLAAKLSLADASQT